MAKRKTGHFNTVIKRMKNKGVRYKEFVEVLNEAERLLKIERLDENFCFDDKINIEDEVNRM